MENSHVANPIIIDGLGDPAIFILHKGKSTLTQAACCAWSRASRIPDLSAVNGFFGPAASGTTIFWVADIFGGSVQDFRFFPSRLPNGTRMVVQNTGIVGSAVKVFGTQRKLKGPGFHAQEASAARAAFIYLEF